MCFFLIDGWENPVKNGIATFIISIIVVAMGVYIFHLVLRKDNKSNGLGTIQEFVAKFFLLSWSILCFLFAALMVYGTISSVKDVKQGTIILELSNCSTYVHSSEEPSYYMNSEGQWRSNGTRTETDYYLKGIDYSGKEWKFEIGKSTYDKYFGEDFSGKVCLEVWENINSIEKIISVEPSSNKMQESTD